MENLVYFMVFIEICILCGFYGKLWLFFLVTAIPFKAGTHVKYFFKDKEIYKQYYGYLIRISAQHVPEFKPVMMTKMVEWLRKNIEDFAHILTEIIHQGEPGTTPVH